MSDSVNTNQDDIVTQSVTGEITHPRQGRSPYNVTPDGETEVVPGTGGVTYNKRVGDSCVGLAVDHVEPAASFSNLDDGKRSSSVNYGFNTLACIGNEAELAKSAEDEDEELKNGTVVGKHGGVEHVMIDFPDATLQELRVGDRVHIKACGLGLELTSVDVDVLNASPELIEALDLSINDGVLSVPVTHEIPARIMGSGLGQDSADRGDYDIQMFDQEIVDQYGLDSLRFGDLVAIKNADHEHGRIYRGDAVTIGVIVHSDSNIAGHGPGVTTLFTSANGAIKPEVQSGSSQAKANLATILDLRDGDEINFQ